MTTPQLTKTIYFLPDPHGTGQSVAIEAESQEDALKKLAKMKDHEPTANAPQEANDKEHQ